MAGGMGVGVGLDLSQLTTQINHANTQLNQLVSNAQRTAKEISMAFNRGGKEGIRAFIQELENANSSMSALMNAGGRIRLNPQGVKGDSRVIVEAVDQINKILNQTRLEFEKLNAAKLRPLIDKRTDINSINELEQRLQILQQRLQTGTFALSGKPLSGEQRVNTANEIRAIQERLGVLRMSTGEYQKLKAQESMAVLEHANRVVDAKNKEIEAERRANEEGKRRAQQAINNYNRELQAARSAYQKRYQMYADMWRKMDMEASQQRASNYAHIQNYGDTSKQAMAAYDRLYSDKGVMSLQNMERTLAKLELAQSKVNTKTEQGKQKYAELGDRIKRLKGDIAAVRGENDKLAGSVSSLGQLFIATYALQYVRRFIGSMVELRGEFELQQVSLRAIIQDADKANEVWDKTVALAVKSPFRVKDLVTYTKQLAAYRIETDKLYETNKMLADVSAGLGVDMNRLILAYGQVKAAAYLRGTELRQFSEAGVNMLGELSKYFTEIEGKAVSVGEVFERISKRKVVFADVEAVFKRITSAGGTFYQMQEKQAETIKGMSANLKDSIDLMFNEMGKESSDTIKGVIKFVRQLVESWRELRPVIVTAGVALATYFSLAILQRIGTMMAGIASANPWILTVTAIAAVGAALYSLLTYESKFTAMMNEVNNAVTNELRESIALYHELVDTINDSTESLENRNKAYDELKSKFSSILPDMYLEKSYIESLSGDYAAAEQAMMSYYNAKAVEQKKARIEQEFAGTLEGTDVPDLIGSVNAQIDELASIINGGKKIDERTAEIARSAVSGIVNGIVDELKSGKLEADAKIVAQEIQSRLEKYIGQKLPVRVSEGIIMPYFYSSQIDELLATVEEYRERMESVEGLPFETHAEKLDAEKLSKYKEELESLMQVTKDLQRLYTDLAIARNKGGDGKSEMEIIDDYFERAKKEIPKYVDLIEWLNSTFKESAYGGFAGFEIGLSSLKIDENWFLQQTIKKFRENLEEESNIEAEKIKRIISNLLKRGFTPEDGIIKLLQSKLDAFIDKLFGSDVMDNFSEELETRAAQLDMKPLYRGIVNAMAKVSKEFNVDLDIFAEFLPSAEQSLNDVVKLVKNKIDSMKEEIKAFRTSEAEGSLGITERLFGIKKAEIDELEKVTLPATIALWKLLGGSEKDTGGSDKKLQQLKNQLNLLKEMNQQYEKLLDNMTEEEAKLSVITSYKDTLKSLGLDKLGFDIEKMDFSDDGTIASLEKLKQDAVYAGEKYQAEIFKVLDNLKVELGVEAKIKNREKLEKDIERLFDFHELSKEIDKSGLSKVLGESLWGIKHISTKDLRQQIEALKPQFEALGNNGVEAYEKAMEKVSELENKDARKRIEDYSKYLKKGVSERVNMKMKELEELKRIEDSPKFTSEQKDRIKKGVSKEARKEQTKQEWKEFQETDMYTMMFEDLAHYGTAAIEKLHSKLTELKKSMSDLPANEVKEIVRQIEQLENIKIESNPFESWKTYADEVKKIGLTEDELVSQLGDWKEIEADAQNYLDVIHLIQQAATKEVSQESVVASFSDEQAQAWTIIQEMMSNSNETLDSIATTQSGIVSDAQKEQGIIITNLNSYQNLSKSQQAAYKKTETWLNAVGDVFSASKELMTALGVESDSVAMTIADTGSSMISLILSAVQFTAQLQLMEVAANQALGIIGYVAIAIQAIATVLTAIFTTKDNQLKRQIELSQREVEKLNNDFEELEKKIDKAYDVAQLQQFNRELAETTELTIAQIDAQIAAQEQRKGAGKEGSDAWKELQDMYQSREEAEKSLADALEKSMSKATAGILDSVYSAAKEFTDAWYDAFKETGDGLSGLQENFSEMFMNLAKNQAAMQITSAYVERWKESLGQYINKDDTELTKEEALEWAEGVKASFPALNEALEAFLGTLHESLDTTGSLSELQKGIQGITEDTAQVLESLLNSMRFYVADSNSQIKQQTQYMRDIYNMLSSLTTISTNDGIGFKVVMV